MLWTVRWSKIFGEWTWLLDFLRFSGMKYIMAFLLFSLTFLSISRHGSIIPVFGCLMGPPRDEKRIVDIKSPGSPLICAFLWFYKHNGALIRG